MFHLCVVSNKHVYLIFILIFLGEKQAATHISLDQEYDNESSQQWRELEEQVVALVNKGVIPPNFHPTQYCLNSFSDNSRFPLAVVEGDILEFLHMVFCLFYIQCNVLYAPRHQKLRMQK